MWFQGKVEINLKKVLSYEPFFLVCITILLIFDYFPEIPLINIIPLYAIKWIILTLFLITILISHRNKENTLKWQIFIVSFILVLMGLLTVIGGNSASGISFGNKYLWVVLFITILDMLSQFKKYKHSSNMNKT